MAKFFTEPNARKKRRREGAGILAPSKRKRADADSKPRSKAKRPRRDESISGSNSDDSNGEGPRDGGAEQSSDTAMEEEETGAEKRLRLAEQYLEKVRSEVAADGGDLADLEEELVGRRLHEDVAEAKGRMYRSIAASFDYGAATVYKFRAPPQCIFFFESW